MTTNQSTDRRRDGGHRRSTDAVLDARYWPTLKAVAALAASPDRPAGIDLTTVQALGAAVLRVHQLHDLWADTPVDQLDPAAMWEQLGAALGVQS